MRRIAAVAVAAGVAGLLAAGHATAGSIRYANVVGPQGTAQVAVKVFRAAAFEVVLRTSTRGRTRLFLEGRSAPRGGPLIDTRTSACEGAAGSLICRGAFEALPRGTYTFRVEVRGAAPGTVGLELAIDW